MMPLRAMRSSVGTAALKALSACALSPPDSALATFLQAVRMAERMEALCWRCFSACRMRFLACAVFAKTVLPYCDPVEGGQLCRSLPFLSIAAVVIQSASDLSDEC